jgi:hypothetical protein
MFNNNANNNPLFGNNPNNNHGFGGQNNQNNNAGFGGQPSQSANNHGFGGVANQDFTGVQKTPEFGGALKEVMPFSLGTDNNVPSFDTRQQQFHGRINTFDQGAVRSVRVLQCNFAEMPEQQTMGFRPYISNVTNSDVLNIIPEFVKNNRPGAGFRSESMNSIVNDIITLSPNSLGAIPIVNGWGIKRYSVTIMAEIEKSNGSIQRALVEGFTDTPDLSTATGAIHVSKEMVIYVNNVTNFSQRQNLNTNSIAMIPYENYNVINKDPFASGAPTRTFVTQRPYDIANGSVNGLLAGNASQLILDSRSTIATDPKVSNLNNNNPATYVAKILNEGITAVENSNTDSIFNTTAIRNMSDQLQEPMLPKNSFLVQLGKVVNGTSAAVSSFTWRDLLQLDPGLENPHCPYLNVFTNNQRAGWLPQTGLNCDDVSGSGHEQQFAALIANGIADIMGRCKAVAVTLLASNHSGVDEVNVTSLQCYDQNEIPLMKAQFEQMMLANIIQMYNYSMQFPYNIGASSYLWGETFVKINLGYGQRDFLFPNFANSMYSPVLTNNKADSGQIGQHLMTIAHNVNNAQQNEFIAAHSGSNLTLG